MDQKRAMLYPPIETASSNTLERDQRMSASIAMGLPIEAPPSYDVAVASPAAPTAPKSPEATSPMGWKASNAGEGIPTHQLQPQAQPQPSSHHHYSGDERTRTPIVEQPHSSRHSQQQPQPQPQSSPHQPYQQQSPQSLQLPISVATAPPPKLGPNPCAVTCPACGACKTTRMCYTPNTRTHLCALLLCLVGWCCCACWVPYCMNSCRTGNHYCSKCNTFLGAYNPRAAK